MRRLLGAMLLLGLAGCSSTDWFHQNEPVKPLAPETQAAPPPEVSQAPSQAAPGRLSPAASAAAPADASARTGELLDCVTESCRINCSPKVKPQFRPKWCAQFKEPL